PALFSALGAKGTPLHRRAWTIDREKASTQPNSPNSFKQADHYDVWWLAPPLGFCGVTVRRLGDLGCSASLGIPRPADASSYHATTWSKETKSKRDFR